MQGQYRRHRLHPARGPLQMPEMPLDRGDGNVSAAEYRAQRTRLREIPLHRRRRMGVHMDDVHDMPARVPHRPPHGECDPGARRVRRRHVVGVGGQAPPRGLAVDPRPRARACSSASRTSTPAPSPFTNPSRSLPNGRDGDDPSATPRVDSARIAANDAMIAGVTTASAPPARATSIRPYRMRSIADPIASVPEAHAAVTVRASPVMCRSRETWDDACDGTVMGVVSGETARGPFSRSLRSPPTRIDASPRIVPRLTPIRSGSSPALPRAARHEPGVAPRLPRGQHRELRRPVHPPRRRPRQQLRRVHGHGPGHPHGQLRELLALQLPYPVPSFEQPPPQLADPDPERRDGPQPGHHHPPRPTDRRRRPLRPRQMPYDMLRVRQSPHLGVGRDLVRAAVEVPVPHAPAPYVRHLVGARVDHPQRGHPVALMELGAGEVVGDEVGIAPAFSRHGTR